MSLGQIWSFTVITDPFSVVRQRACGTMSKKALLDLAGSGHFCFSESGDTTIKRVQTLHVGLHVSMK
jgi:hypothetical protein